MQHMERFAAAPVRRVDEAALTALKEVNPSVVVLRDTAETAAVQVFEQAAAALQGEFVFAAVAEADGDGSARRISIERNAAWLQSEGAGLNATVLYDESVSVDALTKVRLNSHCRMWYIDAAMPAALFPLRDSLQRGPLFYDA